ncbi:MAG: OmpA family protein [Deltaproteobacteria bacterium]|nr:OmpA family protein [Deltaproteobacteria bacterium]
MKKIGMLIIFIALITVVGVARAEVKAGSFSVTPFAGGYFFEGNEDLKHSYTVGLRAGYNFTENLGVEGFFHYVPTEFDDVINTDIDIYGYGIEGLYNFMPGSRFVPFLAVGIGGMTYNLPSGMDNVNKFAVDYGAGLKFFVTDNIALRADVRHVLPLNDNYNDLLVTLGVSFAFGGKQKEVIEPKAEETVAPPEVVVDSDKDGVPDKFDRCSDTPAGLAVDKDGCSLDSDKDGVPDSFDKCPDTPLGVTVNQDGCIPDSDKDGVPDNLDKCPGTPAGAVVDKNGCIPDSDNDGISDNLDKCPGTPAGTAVEKDGCVHEKVSITLNVEFDTAKSVVKKKYHDEVKKVADFMKENPEAAAVIEGHTDNVDKDNNPDKNIKLSQARADSVRQYLIDKFGIDGARLSAIGYGPNKPIASNDTEKGRKKNRRVEAVIEVVKVK